MGTTPTWGLRYPEQADPADVPTDIHELADDIGVALNGLAARLTALEAGVGSLVQLADVKLVAAAPNIDIGAIAQTYSALKLVFVGRCDFATVNTTLGVQFNGVTTATYDHQRVYGTGATPNASEQLAGNSIQAASLPGASAGANMFCAAEMLIPDYTSALHFTTLLSTWGRKSGNTTGDLMAGVWAGAWRSTANITRVTLIPGQGNFVAGTRATLYGMR